MKNFIPKVGAELPKGLGTILAHDKKNDRVLVNRGVGYQPFVVWTIDDEGNVYHGRYFKTLQGAVNRFNNYHVNPTKKKRAKKSPKGRAKVTRKKNPRRKAMYLIFNWNDYQLAFLHATNQWTSRTVALRFTTKKHAEKIARSAARNSRDLIGVAPDSMTNAQIITAVKDGCVKQMRKKKGKA